MDPWALVATAGLAVNKAPFSFQSYLAVCGPSYIAG